jgi:hypothetical protein
MTSSLSWRSAPGDCPHSHAEDGPRQPPWGKNNGSVTKLIVPLGYLPSGVCFTRTVHSMAEVVHFATEPHAVPTLWLRRLFERTPRLVLADVP